MRKPRANFSEIFEPLRHKDTKEHKAFTTILCVPSCLCALVVQKQLSYLCHMTQLKDDLQVRWWNLEAKLVERFGKKPDMETLLFLIGIQELGQTDQKFTKEQKQDLMHIAVCTLLVHSGYYILEGKDDEGWPHFRQLKSMPEMNAFEQESFLKDHILLYFQTSNFFD